MKSLFAAAIALPLLSGAANADALDCSKPIAELNFDELDACRDPAIRLQNLEGRLARTITPRPLTEEEQKPQPRHFHDPGAIVICRHMTDNGCADR